MPDLLKLEHVLGLSFRHSSLLKEAMTHKTFAEEFKIPYDNQRLEFLGDSVIQIILTRYLYDRYSDLQEGALSQIRAALVCQESLSFLARQIDLGSYLLLGKGAQENREFDRDSTLCDVFEAFIGAVYLDQGEECAKDFFLDLLLKYYPSPADLLAEDNPKGELQEYSQSSGKHLPEYRILSVTGPEHNPSYVVEVSIKGLLSAQGTASSKKGAERNAAKAALQLLKTQNSGK